MFAFIFAALSAFVIAGYLTGGKSNGERLFLATILSFVILLFSGFLLNFVHQIGSVQLVVLNVLMFFGIVYGQKKLEFSKPELHIADYLVILVFLFGLYIRAAPIIIDPMPFGSYDTIQHYAMSMETYENGGVPNEFPKYMNWYGVAQDNVNGVWIYPPGNAIMMAVSKYTFGLSWPVTLHFFSALFDAMTILVVYLISYELTKSRACGLLSGFLISVSSKNLFSLYFGQLAYELGIMLATLSILLFILRHGKQPRLTVLSGIVAGLAFITSPLAAGYSVFICFLISLSEFLKGKAASYAKEFFLMVVVAATISLFFIPKFVLWFSFFTIKSSGTPDAFTAAELVWPFKMIEKHPGLPGWYFDPIVTLGMPWLVLIAAGLVLLFATKFEKRRVIAAWLIGDYILTHIYILWGALGFGILYDYSGRWMAQSPVVFAVLAGLIAFVMFDKKNGKLSVFGSGISVAYPLLIIILLFYAPDKLSTASGVYAPPYRITEDVYSLMPDIRADAKENSAMLVFSPNLQVADERRGLIEALSKSRVYTQPNIVDGKLDLNYVHVYTGGNITYNTRYIMFDYGGFAKLAQFKSFVESMETVESVLFNDAVPDYQKGDVRIYKTGL